jgi:hypothetical protein
MKTIKRMLTVACSLVLLAGCVESVDSETDDEDVADVGQAVEVTSKNGSFTWDGVTVSYKSFGGVNNNGSLPAITSPATTNQFEILALGASLGGDSLGNVDVDKYFDAKMMTDQGFQGIGVKGSGDKKIEMWVRKFNGKSKISLPTHVKSYDLVVLIGRQLNLGGITKNTVQSANSTTWTVPSLLNAPQLNVVAYYGDDSFEVLDTKGGVLLFNKWGFGDGDSLNVMFYKPGTAVPGTISVTRHDSGGSQYVGIRAHLPHQ